LDSLYDAVIGIVNNGFYFELDTLHSINSSGRTVCIINDREDEDYHLHDLDLLMSRDCERIPHKTNPAMDGIHEMNKNEQNVMVYPSVGNQFEKIQITSDRFSDAVITVYDLLGNAKTSRRTHFDEGDNIEYFNTSDWVSETYIVKIETTAGRQTTKFLIHH
jgi:hypothetical protein